MRTLKVDDTLFDYVLNLSALEHPAKQALREATRSHPHAGMQIGAAQATCSEAAP